MFDVPCSMFGTPVTRHPSPVTRHPQSGVALVVTLILLSVITFLAVTFLVMTQREKGSVTVSTEQKVAALAAENALDRAVAEINATILAANNPHVFDLLVSTNYVNPIGFDPGALPQSSPNPTNVNYDYTINGTVLNANQRLQNLANLMYNPRPPVIITNRQFANSNDFRFYVDLNRDGAFTQTGLLIVTNELGGFYTTNGIPITPQNPPPFGTLSNWFIGDPQFIGILERPELPHSSSNRFVARYAFIVIPAGKTLDVNYIHNHAKPTPPAADGFFRNMGVGSWENNLAAFLRDLNTNVWNTYFYNTGNTFSTGVAFEDARSITRYRYGGNQVNLGVAATVIGRYGQSGADAFVADYVDGYTRGPLLTDYRGWQYNLVSQQDGDVGRTDQPWSGADNPFHFYTTQDLFDRTKSGYGAAPFNFVDRIYRAQTNSLSSYDRNTYYRLLAQLGTDSAPDPDEKLNVNYINVGGWKSTNFVSWNDSRVRNGDAALGIAAFNRPGSEVFFTSAVDRMLKRYSREWRSRNPQDYANTFGVNQSFGVTNIPVLVNGRFAYTPAVHRLLQMAANIWDATHPQYFPNSTNAIPTVFRPVLWRESPPGSNVFIVDFREVAGVREFNFPAQLVDLSTNPTTINSNTLAYGVPLIIGARKGLPNFNEFATESIVSVTRKVELRKSGPGGSHLINQTNQMFIIGISNALGAEFWNSYVSDYPRPVQVVVRYEGSVGMSNASVAGGTIILPTPSRVNYLINVPTNAWSRWNRSVTGPSFVVPLRTSWVNVPDSVYAVTTPPQHQPQPFMALTTEFEQLPPSRDLPMPRWHLTITNRLVAYIVDEGTFRLLDYVQLGGMTAFRDITSEMAQPSTSPGFSGIWGTNTSPSGIFSGRPGVIQQIEISKGNFPSSDDEWQNYAVNLPAGATRVQEIAKFNAFMSPNNQSSYTENGIRYDAVNTNTVAIAPFTPTWKQSLPMLWQANDPLIHYTTGDMEFLERSFVPQLWVPASGTNVPTMGNLGRVNERYRPWGGNPIQTGGGSSTEGDENAYNLVVKDPGIRSSGDWQFPTNKLATLGWLGRVHRGSPWQTVYLKADPATNAVGWQRWSGNRNVFDAANTQPETDRVLFDVFTTAFNENATRGQLPINQTNLAAWSAVLSGVVALTNSSTVDDIQNGLYRYDPWIIDPAGVYDPFNTNAYPAVAKIVAGINRERSRTVLVNGNNVFVHRNATFNRLGDILAVPELTTASPYLNRGVTDEWSGRNDHLESLNDVIVEWLPQQIMSLVKLGEPRFVVYAYGQGLKPAPRSVVTSGAYFGMVTNYQITAEVVMRAVVRLEGAPDNPRAVVESYNVLGPD